VKMPKSTVRKFSSPLFFALVVLSGPHAIAATYQCYELSKMISTKDATTGIDPASVRQITDGSALYSYRAFRQMVANQGRVDGASILENLPQNKNRDLKLGTVQEVIVNGTGAEMRMWWVEGGPNKHVLNLLGSAFGSHVQLFTSSSKGTPDKHNNFLEIPRLGVGLAFIFNGVNFFIQVCDASKPSNTNTLEYKNYEEFSKELQAVSGSKEFGEIFRRTSISTFPSLINLIDQLGLYDADGSYISGARIKEVSKLGTVALSMYGIARIAAIAMTRNVTAALISFPPQPGPILIDTKAIGISVEQVRLFMNQPAEVQRMRCGTESDVKALCSILKEIEFQVCYASKICM
jgi:hypothetical protein